MSATEDRLRSLAFSSSAEPRFFGGSGWRAAITCRRSIAISPKNNGESFEGVLPHGRDAWLAERTAVGIVEGICGLLDKATFRMRIIKQAN